MATDKTTPCTTDLLGDSYISEVTTLTYVVSATTVAFFLTTTASK